MFITIINDCRDSNTLGRQATRAARLFPNACVTTIGIEQNELEGAGNLIDMLDASGGANGLVMLNVAPRQGRGKKWPNGTPFGYFYYKKTLVIATVAEQSLSLVKKFHIIVPTVVDTMIGQGLLEKKLRDLIVKSQFRSYDYMPRLAKWLFDGITVPSKDYSLSEVVDAPLAVWWVDNFGNCKTTIFPEEVGHKAGEKLKTKVGEILCYERLKDLPDGEAGLIIGSSGLNEKRFLELVVQGKSAAAKFGLKPGSALFG